MRLAARSLLLFLALLVCAGGAQRALAAPTPAPGPTLVAAPEDTAVTKIARAELDAWKGNNLDLTRYIAGAGQYFTADIRQKAATFLTGLGDVSAFTYAGKATQGDKWAYAYLIKGSKASGEELIHLGADGKIDFIYFIPA
jgi:hypothetical protein